MHRHRPGKDAKHAPHPYPGPGTWSSDHPGNTRQAPREPRAPTKGRSTGVGGAENLKLPNGERVGTLCK